MAKEKLNFRITGKSISYEGHPEKRPKDLMDILAKMGVVDDVVLPTFRENITTQADYSDEQVMEMFHEATAIREEKKRAKNGGAPPAAAAVAAAAEAEVPQKITLTYAGKQFSYQGLLSGKRNAVLQLLVKQKDVAPESAVETYRVNLPEDPATDAEILTLVETMRNKKSRNHKDANDARTGAAPANQAGAAGGVSSGSPATRDAASYDAIDELAGMTSKQRDDLNDFIRQVLEGPTADVGALLREEPKPRKEVDDHASDMQALTQRTSGKMPVYLQEANTTGTKLIYATPSMTYDEFLAAVEKKFGRKMALSFYEGEDIIELDDDDVLAMYLEMTVNGDAKKLRLICSNPETRRREVDDSLTEGRQQSVADAGSPTASIKAAAYSNGELTVTDDHTYTGHSAAVYCCAFSPKGDLFVTASRDRSVRVWNVRTGSNTVMKGGHNGFVLSCDYSPKGNRVVSSSDDRTIKVWNTSTCSKVATLKGHEDKVYCVKYSPSGEYIVSGSCDHTVRVWNADTQSRVTTLKGHTLAVFSCAFSNSDNGKYVVSGSDDRIIKIWDWSAGKEIKSLVGHIGTVWTVAFSHSDTYIVSGSMDYELMLWDAEAGTRVRSMDGHKISVHHALFSEDDKYILSCARDMSVMVWRTEDGERVEAITGHTNTVYHMDMKGDTLLTASLDRNLKLWTIKRK